MSKLLGFVACIGLLISFPVDALCEAPPPTSFYSTRNSDDWVRRNLNLQTKYLRVLLVGDTENFPKTVGITELDLNFRAGALAIHDTPVSEVHKTLQEAADAAHGGDIIVVMPGTYAGFEIGDKPDAADGRYIHFKTLGEPGAVTVDRAAGGRDSNWMIYLRGAHHVIVDGFNVAGTTGPGLDPKGPRAGIMIDGDFGNTGKMAHHIVIVNNFSHNHRSWGLHATDSHTVLIQNNVFALSCQEHSAYVSDGSDNYCIRNNVFFGSSASGLQCNLDPDASLDELLRHPDLRDYPLKGKPSFEWAQGLLKLAAEKFGENNFPDGRGIDFLIENNVIDANGKRGGGSLNLAGLQDSVIQNNLIYGNFTTGIAEWDNANSFDTRFVDPGPKSPDDVKGPESLSLWGCHGNLIRNNTVIMNNPDRVDMLLNNGSWGNKLRNNIFMNDLSFSIEVSDTSAWRLDSGYNVINRTSITPAFARLTKALDENNHSVTGVTREKIADEFVNFNEEPWILVAGTWWKLNPDRPDFRPQKNSKLLRGKGDPEERPDYDLAGFMRAGVDIGACDSASLREK